MSAWSRRSSIAHNCCVRAERAVSRALGGSCSLPLAAYAECSKKLRLRALVASSDGKRVIRCDLEGEAGDPEAVGERAAAALRAQGAEEILGI
jgi:hydroxymethylbilane synthase